MLIGTGLAAGLLAAGIDIVTNWLGDLKHGYCNSHFYLSREFCCLGLERRFLRVDRDQMTRRLIFNYCSE